MPRRISAQVEGRILALGAQKYSRFMIKKELLKSNIVVSERTVTNVLNREAKAASNNSGRGPLPKKRKPPKTGNSKVIKKIKDYSAKDNAAPQTEMARRTKVSQMTVCRVINKKLDRKLIKKKTIKRFNAAMIDKRKKRAKPFAALVAGKNKEFILTLDEALLPLNFMNGQTTHSYQPRKVSERSQNQPVATSAPQFPRSIMYAAGFTWRGQTRFYHIPENSKMNAEVFIHQVLRPMMLEDVPKLYGKDARKVVLHMDSATSHTCTKTVEWLKEHQIKFITKEQWLPNSPKVSPMDYFGNGYLKSKLQKRQYSTMRGMVRAAKEEWSKIPLDMLRNALSSWSSRVLSIHKARGHDILQ